MDAALRPEVVVDDVEHDTQALGVGGIDEAGQGLGSAVGLLHRRREHPVVAPVAFAGKGVDRHQLDGRHAERGQAIELPGRGVERALGRERPDVQLVEHGVEELDTSPAVVGPAEPAGVDDGRGSVDAVGLPARRRVGDRLTAVETEPIAVAVPDIVDHAHPRLGAARRARERPCACRRRRRRARPRRCGPAAPTPRSASTGRRAGAAPSLATTATADHGHGRSSIWATAASGHDDPGGRLARLPADLVQRLEQHVGVEQQAVSAGSRGTSAGALGRGPQGRQVAVDVQPCHPLRPRPPPPLQRRPSAPRRPGPVRSTSPGRPARRSRASGPSRRHR